MRKKSLLVSANAPFTGPRVILEEGTWIIDEIDKGIEINVKIVGGEAMFMSGDLRLVGPVTVQAELLNGLNICLSARQVSDA